MSVFSYLFYWLTRPFIKTNVVLDSDLNIDPNKPVSYVMVTDSFSDQMALHQATKQKSLPSPFTKLKVGYSTFARTLGVKPQKGLTTSEHKHQQEIIQSGTKLLAQVKRSQQDVQFVPVMICWG